MYMCARRSVFYFWTADVDCTSLLETVHLNWQCMYTMYMYLLFLN